MSHWALILGDLLLAAGFTARLTRLVITDDLGAWWLRDPLDAWFHRQDKPHDDWGPPLVSRRMRWHRYLAGLVCPFCIGFQIGWLVLLSLWLVGGPGHAAEWWRYVAGTFTLNWVVAHVGVRLGDAGYATDD